MKYIKYRVLLQEPVRIADDSSAKQGQAMTKLYIPGSTIRGHVINSIAKEFSNAPFFPMLKKELFSDRIRFQNAYMTVLLPATTEEELNADEVQKGSDVEVDAKNADETEGTVTDREGTRVIKTYYPVLLPSPKGFYEDKSVKKGEKFLENVTVSGEFDESYKRAKIGTNVLLDAYKGKDQKGSGKRTIYYYKPEIQSDTKIRLGKKDDQDVFRSTSIRAGHRFIGYIAIDDSDICIDGLVSEESGNTSVTLAELVKKTIDGQIILGNARTSGFGKCLVEKCIFTNEQPYLNYAISPVSNEDDVSINEVYMMLLSDMVMRNKFGEYCGIDIPALQTQLGVSNLRVEYCATTVADTRGFNRHYGGAIPSAPMYEKGSVFHLTYEGSIDTEKLERIHRKGIGIRRNEGFGQVLFVRDYEDICFKREGRDIAVVPLKKAVVIDSDVVAEHNEDSKVIKIAAKAYLQNQIRYATQEYVVDKKELPANSRSQFGNILSIAIKNRYNPDAGWDGIKKYFEHKIKKEEGNRVHGTKRKASSDPVYKYIISIKDTPLDELLDISLKAPEPVNADYDAAKAAASGADAPQKASASQTDASGTDAPKLVSFKEREVMGFSVGDLLGESEIKHIKLELLIQLIRYNFKKEVRM